jgi:hypothetical protein
LNLIQTKWINGTVHMGSKRPTTHSPGRARPSSAGLWQPIPPECGHDAIGRAQCTVTARGRGELTGASPVAKTRRQTGCIHLRTMGSLPLHPMHEERVGRGILTDEARGAVEIGGSESEKRLLLRWKHFGPVLQLHKREGNMRRWLGHLASDERWRN